MTEPEQTPPQQKIEVALRPLTNPQWRGWRSRIPRPERSTPPEELLLPLSVEKVLLLLRWLVIGLALAVQLYTAGNGGGVNNIARALQFTALVAVYNSLWLALRYLITTRTRRVALAIADVSATTLIISWAGGVYSPYVFLLYLIIVEAALLFTPSAVLTFTAVMAMGYVVSSLLLSGQQWNELTITLLLSMVLGMFIWASICGAIYQAFEQERSLVRREQSLRTELDRQVIALSSLNRLSEQLNASLDLDELMRSTVKALPDALLVDACVAFSARLDISEVSNKMAISSQPGWQLGSVWYGVDEDFEPLPVPPNLTTTSEADAEGAESTDAEWVQIGPLWLTHHDLERLLVSSQPVRLPIETLLNSNPDPTDSDLPALPAILIVPFGTEEGFGGGLALVRQAGPGFTASDQEILSALARQLSYLTHNARLYEMERRNVARLQELEQMKNDFLSTVSHELRTPLTSIKASAILMLSKPLDTASSQKLLRNVERNTDRLSALVTELLDMAKLQNGRIKLALRPLHLEESIRAVMLDLRPLTDSKQQTVSLHASAGLPPVYADSQRLEQILTNLLSNAQRYAPRQSAIVISLDWQEGQIRVGVQDEGPGISTEEQAHVFERFYRGQNSKNSSGTGLGLAIAKSLVELHSGSIWVESPRGGEAGAGSVFYFTLPVAAISTNGTSNSIANTAIISKAS